MASATTDGQLRVLVVDDEDLIHEVIARHLKRLGHLSEHVKSAQEALDRAETQHYDIALVDVHMPEQDGLQFVAKAQDLHPRMACVIMTGYADMETAIRALKLGAADFLTKPIRRPDLKAALQKAEQVRDLRHRLRHSRETIKGMQASEELRRRGRRFVGVSSAAEAVRCQVREAVAAACDTILVTGETGTGKEVVARAIHFAAAGDESPFIAVSCPALPESLVESQLFGHVKGTFTGASGDRIGYFELAHEGTLFLDEVGELSPSAQATLLRVLETRTLRRVGGAEEVRVDVRLIAATNADLRERVKEGSFRADLLYRLDVYPIRIPPLRERPEDIMPLAEHFLSVYTESRGLPCEGFSAAARESLLNYSFPGNARELRNVVERAAIVSRSSELRPQHFGIPAVSADAPVGEDGSPIPEGEREMIQQALEDARWNRREAARKLEMPYSTLRYKMQKLGIG